MAVEGVRFVQPDLNRRLLAIVPSPTGEELRVRIQRGDVGWQWKCDGCAPSWKWVSRSMPCRHVGVVLAALRVQTKTKVLTASTGEEQPMTDEITATTEEIPAEQPARGPWPWAVAPDVAEGDDLPDHLPAAATRFPGGLFNTEKGWNE